MHSTDILGDAGFRTVDAQSADEALPILERLGASIVLLFTDVDMPGSMNGFQLAQFVDRQWPEIAIVVVSGHISPDPGDMPDKATFVNKPFSPHIVYDHIRAILPDGKEPEPLKTAV